jgi:hypothetical protein
MAKPKQIHVVRQGQHLFNIALQHGVPASDLWNAGDNAGLAKEGRAPAILAPGDLLTLPVAERKFLPLKVGSKNSFVATVPVMTVAVRALDENGEAVANEPWEAPDLGATGTTKADGTILIEKVPLKTDYVDVHLPKRLRILRLNVGHLDPVSTPSGRAQRLGHLGYLPVGSKTPPDDALQWALDRFKATEAPHAADDGAVADALVKAHGV